MPENLEDIASGDLLAASETNMAGFWSAYGHGAGCRLEIGSGVVWLYTGIHHPLFNGVVSVRSTPAAVSATLEKLKANIAKQGAPALWWVGPRSRPEDLVSMLQDHGLQPAGGATGMALDLGSFAEKLRPVADLTVETVGSTEMQAEWARTAALGTNFSQTAAEELARVEASLGDPAYRAQRRYIGYLKGAPVATSALVLEAGVAGIYAVATLEAARGRGIGRYLTTLPLLEAKRMGYRVAILQASTMGHPLYRRMGFQDLCAYRLYLQS